MIRCLVFFLLLGSIAASAQTGVRIDVGNNSAFDGFGILDSQVAQSRFIIFGENREYPSFNSRLEFKSLKYFNRKFGLRNYVLAAAPSKAWLVDRFVNSDDSAMETLLKSVSNPRYMKLYRNLKKLNKGLPDSLRIRVFGLDIERSASLPAVRIAAILPETGIPDRLRIGVESIRGASKYIIEEGLKEYERQLENRDDYYFEPRQFSVRSSVEQFMVYYDSLKDQFRQWLGPQFPELALVMADLKHYSRYKSWEQTAFEDVWREEMLYRNALYLMDSLPGQRFFTVYGRCHVPYEELNGPCGLYRFSSLARRLRQTGNPAYRPMNMAVHYTSDFRLDSDMSDEPKALKAEVEKLADDAPDKAAVIVRLAGRTDVPLLSANYDFTVLENGYSSLPADMDSTSAGSEEAVPEIPLSVQPPNRLFLGYGLMAPYVDFSAVNAVLASRGLSQIDDPLVNDWQVGFLSSENGYLRLSYGSSSSASGIYSSSRWTTSLGYNVLDNESRTRLIFGYHAGWQRHRIIRPSGNTPQTPLKELERPQRFYNPMTMLGLFGMLKIDFRLVYLMAEGGYMRDLSDSRWRYQGSFNGDVGRLRGHYPYWMVGAGFSIPIGDSSDEEVSR